MVKLEIEILSADAKDYLFELRNFLNERLENGQVSIKEQPALEGAMSPFTSEVILNGVIHAGIGLTIEQCVHVFLPLLKDFFKHIPVPFGKKVEVLATLGDGGEKVTISEDSEGVSKRYDNVIYSIDTDHTRAVLIGNGEFDNDFTSIPPVKNNLEDFYKLLTDKRNIGLPPENISLALNKTNTEIEELLLRISKLSDTETLIIYFSGHGYRSDVSKLHLIARNTRKLDDYILGGVDYDFIKNIILKSTPAKQKIVILDACHSGIATQGAGDAILDINVSGTYVMASSESDEVSYYDKNKRNTFFTGSLLDTLTNGIDNGKEMLALNDLYENAKAHLDQRQLPRYKDKLNISPSDFLIARNPGFSFDKTIEQARQLFKSGNLTGALKEFKKILKRQPDNREVGALMEQCNTDLLSAQFISQGDEYFYHQHQYAKALGQYQQAYEIKADFTTAEKIRNCKAQLNEDMLSSTDLNSKPSLPPKRIIDPFPKKEKELPEDSEATEKKSMSAKLLILGLSLLVALLAWWLLTFIQGREEKTNFTQLKALLDSLPGDAMNQLRAVKEKDSAYYIIGNYYRADRNTDSAAYYYDQAIAVSHLPAAYSALAVMYFNNEVHDSTKMRSPYNILRKADSLYKADTSAYFMLGSIVAVKARIASVASMPDAGSLKDETEKWFQKGYKKGSLQCNTRLGFFYLSERKDAIAAYPYIKRSADMHVPEAELYLSIMLQNGYGIPMDTAAANKWFGIYFQNASAIQLIKLAKTFADRYQTFFDGHTTEPDCLKVARLYQEAERKIYSIRDDHERSDVYLELGNYYYGINAACRPLIQANHVRARAYYKSSADLGNVVARTYLVDSTLIR